MQKIKIVPHQRHKCNLIYVHADYYIGKTCYVFNRRRQIRQVAFHSCIGPAREMLASILEDTKN